MPFVTCPECGKRYDAHLKECPECACPNDKILEGESTPDNVFLSCPECGCPLAKGDTVCPECGCPVSNETITCSECGELYDAHLKECPECGCPNETLVVETPQQASESQVSKQPSSVLEETTATSQPQSSAQVHKGPDYAMSLLRTMKHVIVGYNDFSGRSRRSEFWTFIVFNCMVGFVLYLTLFACIGRDYVSISEATTMGEYWRRLLFSCVVDHLFITIVVIVYVLLALLPLLSVTVRRLHDTGRSGWWVLLAVLPYLFGSFVGLSPFFGCFLLAIMLLLDSVDDNHWGHRFRPAIQ